MDAITFVELQYRWLFAVAPPFVLAVWVWVWHKSRTARNRFMPRSQRVFDEPTRFSKTAILAFMDLALVSCIIAALMHPERSIIVMESVREHSATVIAVDISSSMKAEAGYFGQDGRIGAVKSALRELMTAPADATSKFGETLGKILSFLRGPSSIGDTRLMEGQRIGVVTFAGRAMNEMPPTPRHGTILSVFRLLTTVSDPQDDGTNFPGALEESLLCFLKDDKVKTIIMFTDGEEEEGKTLPIDPELNKIVQAGIKIFPIVVGHERAPVPGKENVFTEPSLALPEYLAGQTGGKVFRFDERGKLYPMLAEIFSRVDEASQEPVEKRENLQRYFAALFLIMFTLRTLLAYLMPGEKSQQPLRTS